MRWVSLPSMLRPRIQTWYQSARLGSLVTATDVSSVTVSRRKASPATTAMAVTGNEALAVTSKDMARLIPVLRGAISSLLEAEYSRQGGGSE